MKNQIRDRENMIIIFLSKLILFFIIIFSIHFVSIFFLRVNISYFPSYL